MAFFIVLEVRGSNLEVEYCVGIFTPVVASDMPWRQRPSID